MAAKQGNQNARKKGPGRIDVHISIANTKEYDRRSKMERYMRSIDTGEGWNDLDIAHVCQQWLYDWIDSLDV